MESIRGFFRGSIAGMVNLGNWNPRTRWFKVTQLDPLVGGHQQPLKGSRFHHPKKVTSRIARKRMFFFFFSGSCLLGAASNTRGGFGKWNLTRNWLARETMLLALKKGTGSFWERVIQKGQKFEMGCFFGGLGKVFFETTMQLPSCKLTFFDGNHNFDGIYQGRWWFSWAMLVSGRVMLLGFLEGVFFSGSPIRESTTRGIRFFLTQSWCKPKLNRDHSILTMDISLNQPNF